MVQATRNLTRERYQTSTKLVTEDETLDRIQYMQEKFTNDSSSKTNTIPDVQVTTSGVLVSHLLGKPYSGFNIITKDSNANVWVQDNPNKDKFIKLVSSSSVKITIQVF